MAARQQNNRGRGRVTPESTKAATRKAADTIKSMHDLMEKHRKAFETALPKHLKADRFLRVALTSFQRNPSLLDCDPRSFLGALLEAAQLGLEVDGVLGHAYLVPYWDRRDDGPDIKVCQLIPGYKGLAQLVYRSGVVQHLEAHIVRIGDRFEYAYGNKPKLLHYEDLDRQQNAWESEKKGRNVTVTEDQSVGVIASYAIAYFKSGGSAFRVVSRRDILRARSLAQTDKVWWEHFDAMATKTAVRRLCKLLPMSVEMQRASALDELAEAQVSQGMLEAGMQRFMLPAPAPNAATSMMSESLRGFAHGQAEGADDEPEKVEAGSKE